MVKTILEMRRRQVLQRALDALRALEKEVFSGTIPANTKQRDAISAALETVVELSMEESHDQVD